MKTYSLKSAIWSSIANNATTQAKRIICIQKILIEAEIERQNIIEGYRIHEKSSRDQEGDPSGIELAIATLKTELLVKSAITNAYSALEYSLYSLCDILTKLGGHTAFSQNRNRSDRNLSEIEKYRRHLERELHIELKEIDDVWDRLQSFRIVRNIAIHSNFDVIKSKDFERVKNIESQNGSVRLQESKRLQVGLPYVRDCLCDIEKFLFTISKKLRELDPSDAIKS